MLQNMKKLWLLGVLMFVTIGTGAHSEKWTNSDAQQFYEAANETYFNNKLPHAVVEFKVNLTDEQGHPLMGLTHESNVAAPRIFLSTRYQDNARIWEGTELHEICHVEVDAHNPEFEEHGPHFQACMLGLAENHAFDDIW
jgi:SprT-like family